MSENPIRPELIEWVQENLREWERCYHNRDPLGRYILRKREADNVLQQQGLQVAQWAIDHKIDDAPALQHYIHCREGS